MNQASDRTNDSHTMPSSCLDLFTDAVVLLCLCTSGFFSGYYFKFTYIYDNMWMHWYAVVGAILSTLFATLWTFKKAKQQQYRFDHFCAIFYGLVCQLISSSLMLTDNVGISFYFGFVSLGTVVVPCFSLLSLHSGATGWRPVRIALGNASYFVGLTGGFTFFNEFEPEETGALLVSLTLVTLLACLAGEVLQHVGWCDYKRSHDRAFNLMNVEKLVFQPAAEVLAMYASRADFYMAGNRQMQAMIAVIVVIAERLTLYSPTMLSLAWSATFDQLERQYLSGPFFLNCIGCLLGCGLVGRYRPKLVYMLFGLIKITAAAAILGVYEEDRPGECFYLLCCYYLAMGVYSSIAWQMLLECMPFLYTECWLTVLVVMEMLGAEALKYELRWEVSDWLLVTSAAGTSIILTLLALVAVLVYLPRSCGLIEMRNKLIGLRRHATLAAPSPKIWNSQYFLHHDLLPEDVTSVKLTGNRCFLQYPPQRPEDGQERF